MLYEKNKYFFMKKKYASTTFSYPVNLNWKFKYYITSKKLRVRNVTSELVTHYMEEEEDNRSYNLTIKLMKEAETSENIEWTEYKRRNQLDGIQSTPE